MKKLNVIKQNEFFFLKFELFNVNHFPTRLIKYERIDFAASNNQLWQISLFQPIWNDF